jgi:hypothetical protein
VAGLVLATLPLFVQASKAYARGVDSLCDIALHKCRDAKLSEFYDASYWNISELEQHITILCQMATAGQSKPASMLDLKQWNEKSDMAVCLRRALGSEGTYHKYLVTTENLAALLALLLADGTLHMGKADMVRTYLSTFVLLPY